MDALALRPTDSIAAIEYPDLKPGEAIAVDWPASVYFADTRYFTRSALLLLEKKPHKFYRRWILGEPGTDEDKSTQAQGLGTNAHLAILEPDEWLRRVQLPAKLSKKATAMEQQLRKMLAARDANSSHVADPIVVTFDEFVRLCGIRESVQRNPWAAQLLAAPGKNEQTILWCDRETGLLLKVRLDRFGQIEWPGTPEIPEGWAIPDLKTSRDPSPAAFGKSAFNYDYVLQASFYTDAAEALTGEPVRFYFIATNSDPSDYETWVHPVTRDQISKGRSLYRGLLDNLLERQFTNDWRQPCHRGLTDLALPNWKRP